MTSKVDYISNVIDIKKKIFILSILTLSVKKELFIRPYTIEEIKNPFFFSFVKKLLDEFDINIHISRRSCLPSKDLNKQ